MNTYSRSKIVGKETGLFCEEKSHVLPLFLKNSLYAINNFKLLIANYQFSILPPPPHFFFQLNVGTYFFRLFMFLARR